MEAATAADVSAQFDPKVHPEVITGRRSPEVIKKILGGARQMFRLAFVLC